MHVLPHVSASMHVRVCVCVYVPVYSSIIMCMCELGYLEKQCNDQIFHIPTLQLKYGEKYAECGLGLSIGFHSFNGIQLCLFYCETRLYPPQYMKH